METQEGPASEVNHAERLRRRLTEGMVVALDEAVPDHVVDAVAYGMGTVQVTRDQLQAHISPQQAYGVDSGQAIARMQRNINQWASDEIAAQTQGPVTTRQELDAFVNASQPIPATPPPIPTTFEYLVGFFETFHGRGLGEADLSFVNSLSLSDKIVAKEAIANYTPQRQVEEDILDLPESEHFSGYARELVQQIRSYERSIQDSRERLRMELEGPSLPTISITRIKEDFSDFWDAEITGDLNLELTAKYDCKLAHTFKERPDGSERVINVNLGKYKFLFRLSDMSFIKCIPQHFRTGGSIGAPHPHVSGYICWGTQGEVAQDAIVRKDFKLFSRLLFQAINSYNHASTFCSLLKYKIILRDYEGETVSFRASPNHRSMRLTELPKGISLRSVYSTDGSHARVLTYRRFMPYLGDYLPGTYFKVSKTVNPNEFIIDERDLITNLPLYPTVDQAEIDKIIEKRGPKEEGDDL